jgi:uncharacterized phage-associated protein
MFFQGVRSMKVIVKKSIIGDIDITEMQLRRLWYFNKTVLVRMQNRLFTLFARDVEPYKEKKDETLFG